MNFYISEHHSLNGFHLQKTFMNGYSVSIIPSGNLNCTFQDELKDKLIVELAIKLEEAFVESFDYNGETRFHMGTELVTSKEALEICNFIQDNFPKT